MTSIRTSEFEQLYELLRSGQHAIKTLSLDCFDTILWRNVSEPVDVFYRMQHQPTFSQLGFNPMLRQQAESSARKIVSLTRGSLEVSLRDIYLNAFPDLDEDTLNGLAEEELLCEKEACFAYPPMLDLIRTAKEVGLDVVVVSDTYFAREQLEALLRHNLPEGAFSLIDRLFCSNEFRRGKSAGLFSDVLAKLGRRPEEVLHIGDNLIADFEAPQAHGINAFHFVHHGQTASQMLKMNSNAAGLLYPEARSELAMPSPFHPVFAAANEDDTDPNVAMGYYAAGPVLYAFARFLKTHADRASRESPPVKYLFLMRDGYLPLQAFKTIAPEHAANCYAVEISRFASYACSFRSADDIDRYLSRMGSDLVEPMARQLLLSEKDSRRLANLTENSSNVLRDFTKQVKKPALMEKIFRASAAYRERFYRYLEKSIDLQSGDRLVLVDLGYTGTAQSCLQPLLEEDKGVSVEGLYLLLANTPGWRASRRGLIDPELVPDIAIKTLVPYVAALEMICTNNEGSVIDYSEEGEPIRKAPDISATQYQRVQVVQDACLRFVSDAERLSVASGETVYADEMRIAALGALGRMTFLPSNPEVACMEGFHLDVNLATDLTVSLFDTDRALGGLRKMGLFHALTDMRMNIPTELRYHSLELSLALMVQHRYQQSYSLEDFSLKREVVKVMLAKGGDTSMTEAAAFPAYDGYYTLIVPVGLYEYDVGIQFGLEYIWVQLGTVTAIAVDDLFARKGFNKDTHASEYDLSSALHLERIEKLDGNLLRCDGPNAFVLVQKPVHQKASRNMAYLINFRPLVKREQE